MAQNPSFEANSHTTLQLLSPGQALYVPAYQRTYTWGSDQIERLFEDILAGINVAAQEPGPPTFLGSAILFEGRSLVLPKSNTALPSQVLHIVDGQQRLTTLLLILGQLHPRIRHAIGALDELEVSAERDWAIANLRAVLSQLQACLWVDLPSASGVFAHLPRLIRQADDAWGDSETNASYDSDIAFYLHDLARQVFEARAPSSIVQRPHLRIVIDSIEEHLDDVTSGSAMDSPLDQLHFASDLSALRRLLPEILADHPIAAASVPLELGTAIRVAVLAQFILSRVVLIDVRAPDEATAFSIFEPLNTTGQPLTPIETLRPLAVASEGGPSTYLASRSDTAFERVGRYVPDELGATERSKRVSSLLTSFALGQDGTKLAHDMRSQRHYLRTKYDGAGDLETKRVFVEGIADTASFLNDVWENADSPLVTMGTPADRLRLEILRASKHVIVVPLLVRYFERAEQLNTDEAREDFRSVVRAATAFWTIWRSSRATTSGIDSLHRGLIGSGLAATSLPPLARSSTTVNDLPTAAEVKAALRHLLDTKLTITDGDSWSSLVNSQQLYETARVLARYILLCAHDDAVPDTSTTGQPARGAVGSWPTLSLEVWRANYTVEHIAPQQRRSSDTSYAPELYDEADINRLGNLTLLPGDLNGLLGNRPWPFKREVFGYVSLTDQHQRIEALQQSDLYGLGAKSKALLESSKFIPFCKFVAMHEDETFDRAYVRERGNRLAELAWERLWADLL